MYLPSVDIIIILLANSHVVAVRICNYLCIKLRSFCIVGCCGMNALVLKDELESEAQWLFGD